MKMSSLKPLSLFFLIYSQTFNINNNNNIFHHNLNLLTQEFTQFSLSSFPSKYFFKILFEYFFIFKYFLYDYSLWSLLLYF